ncbi:late competence development ComFB family protein [Lachnospiraceae bacterium 42-17]|jgi:hypothetical protein|nr:late competence development ComFB family protein [Dorea sp.]
MARKSNKTAHVLNLIAGHEAAKDNIEEASNESMDKTPSGSVRADASPSLSQNISVIDTTEEDPISDLIQEKLSRELEEHVSENPVLETAPELEAEPEPEKTSNLPEENTSQTEADLQSESAVQTNDVSQAEPAVQTSDVSQAEPIMQTDAALQSDHTKQTDEVPQSDPVMQADAALQSNPAPQPEPDFVRWNVMERIVEDKIIYFMRQFDVCTCERCVNDTIALTLNGLLPKYLVTTPAAVDPLLSYYTNRLISDVTVEATKACMIIKDNPRH